MTNKQIGFILAVALVLMATTVILVIALGDRQPIPSAIPDVTASTPGPDPDLQKLLRDSPKIKVFPPNHPEGIEPNDPAATH